MQERNVRKLKLLSKKISNDAKKTFSCCFQIAFHSRAHITTNL
jgi:hypothetical protein